MWGYTELFLYQCSHNFLKKYILHCRSVLCNLYYFYWNIRDLNQVDHDLSFTEPGTTSLGSDISVESLEMSSVSETFFFSEVLHLSFLLCVCLVYLISSFGKENSFIPPCSYITIRFMLKFINGLCYI